MPRRYQPDLLVLAGLLLLPLALFAPVTVGNRTLLPADNLFAYEPWRSARADFGVHRPHNELLSDLVLENYAWKRFIVRAIEARELPLWNPYLFAGEPFLATGQHSALYPFSLLFYLLPLWRAYGVFTVSQMFLAGSFAYLFLRVLGLGRLASALGAVTYELCLFMVVSVVFPMILAGAAWLPLLLACVELIVQQRPALGGVPARLPWMALGAVALGFQILAGHVEVTYYTLLVMAAYSAWRLGGLWLAAQHDLRWRSVLTPAAFIVSMTALGLLLGGVQFIPLLELAPRNFRSGSVSLEQVLGWAYPWRHLIALLIPNFYGNPSHHAYFDLFAWGWVPATVNALGQPIEKIDWGIKNYVEGGAYVGVLPLLLALIALADWASGVRRQASGVGRQASDVRRQTSGAVPFFTLLSALSLAFAFGTPLYALIFWLPGINQLHSPFRWVWLFSLGVAVLAGYGAQALRAPHYRPAEPGETAGPGTGTGATGWLVPALAWLAVGGGVLVVAGVVAARVFFDRLAPFFVRQLHGLAKAAQAFADERMFFSYEARWALGFGLLLIAAGVVLRLSRRPDRSPAGLGRPPLWGLLAVGVVALDLLAAGAGFNPSADPAILAYTPPVVEFLRADTTLWRLTSYDPDGSKPLNANSAWFFDLQDVRGYDSIFPKQYADYMALIQPQGELQFNRIAPIDNPASLESPLLDALNVKYVVSLREIASPKYTLVYDREVRVYRNESAAPRAFMLPWSAAVGVDDLRQAVQQYDPRRYVILDRGRDRPPASLPAQPAPGELSPAEVTQYTLNQVSVDAEVRERSFLILADSFFPGWKAYVRPRGADESTERQVDILRVAGNFRGVILEPGDWTVRFKYSPLSVKAGAFASIIAGMSLALAGGVWLWRFFYRESEVNSTARRVAKNSLAPMALNLMNRGVDLAFAALMLRVLGPGDAGKYYFAVVVIGWFEIFTNFGLNTYLTREVARDRAHANRYLSNTTLLRMGLGALSLPVLALLILVWRQAFDLGADTAWAIVLLAIGLAPASVSTGLTALFYAYEKAEYPAAITSVTTILKVSIGALVLLLGYGFVGLAAATIIVNTGTMLILGWLAVRLFFPPRLEFTPSLQREMLRESFPLMLNHLLATLFFKVDVTLLQPIKGEVQVGWYSTAYKFVDAYNIVPSFFTFALFPVMSRQAVEARPALARSYALAVKLLVGAALPLAVVTTFLARALVGLLGGAEFLPHGAIALALMVWSIPFGWINSVTNYLLIALGQQRNLTRAFLIGLTFNVIANLILLPAYGYAAAAVVTIFSEIVEGAAFYFYLRRSLWPVPWASLLWKPAVAAGAMLGVTALLWPIQPLAALLVGLAVYGAGGLGLRFFDPPEWELLMGILPARLRLGYNSVK